MVPGDLIALSAALGRPLHDVHTRTVVALHVEIAGREARRLSLVQIARDRECLEKYLGHDDSAAEVEDHSSVVERGQRCGEAAEIAVARVSDCGAIRCGMLVDDFGPEGRVDSAGNSQSLSRQEHLEIGIGE